MIIVGAGMIGTSMRFPRESERGYRDVVVIERELGGEGATARDRWDQAPVLL